MSLKKLNFNRVRTTVTYRWRCSDVALGLVATSHVQNPSQQGWTWEESTHAKPKLIFALLAASISHFLTAAIYMIFMFFFQQN